MSHHIEASDSFKPEIQKRELIFLMDQSGSMNGQGIQQAKNEMKFEPSQIIHTLVA